MRLRDVRVTRDDVVQIDEITLRNRQQVREPERAGCGRAAEPPVRRAFRDREREARDRQPQQRGNQDGRIHRQKSFTRRSAS
ncbi:hypothetical protein BURPSS13_C0181 [Burkholderia pseudomallei S13]|nr:hypothetical protein BURPSS13_C0181 [Burkholderia pseudomallei S13]